MSASTNTAVVQVKTAEGFSKGALFEKLAPLEAATRPLMAAACQRLAKEKGQSALQPWNVAYSLSGYPCCCLSLLLWNGNHRSLSAACTWQFCRASLCGC